MTVHNSDLSPASASAYICNAPDAVCLYNSVASAVGCCLPEGCNIWTACIPYLSSAQTSTADMDRTRYWYATPCFKAKLLANHGTDETQLRLEEALLRRSGLYRSDLYRLYHPDVCGGTDHLHHFI